MKSSRSRPLQGTTSVPGDKSISHRALIFGALAFGRSVIRGANVGEDVRATARILSQLGANCTVDPVKSRVEVEGKGWGGLVEPDDVLDAGNSGTSLRILLGICSAVPGAFVLSGDASLRRRPMLRVVTPLRQMGASIDGRQYADLAPLSVRGSELTGIEVELSVASAQVKSAVLLAGLNAAGTTTVVEPASSRDHTERMLTALGVGVELGERKVSVPGGSALEPFDVMVPGDLSSALFLVAAAALVPGSDLTLTGVGLNPTRRAALDALVEMGSDITWTETGSSLGEPTGSIHLSQLPLRGIDVPAGWVPALIDEIPVLAVVATQAEGETRFTGAAELRVKESDRISSLVAGLSALGADVEELGDGLIVRGPTPLRGGEVHSRGDHRLALAFAVAGLIASHKVRIHGWSSVETSFPEFLDVLDAARR